MEPETVPLPSTPAASDAAPTDAAAEPAAEKQKRGLLIGLIAVAGAILVALIVLIVLLVGGQGDDTAGPAPVPTASESESAEPEETESPEPTDEPTEEPAASPSATAAPPPAPQSPSFATFSGPNRATCPDTSSSVAITWSWSSTNAVNAWFGIGTNNAKAEPFESVPTTATYTFNYQCSEASQRYTVTLEDSAGRLTHKTVEIVRQ